VTNILSALQGSGVYPSGLGIRSGLTPIIKKKESNC
jgi:hypothetical protein